MNKKLKHFMEKRGIPMESIEHMIEDKVDEGVIGLLCDEELGKYISSYGDRVAVSAFSKSLTQESEDEAATSSTVPKSLIDRLKAKVKRGKTEHQSRSSSQHGNRNAKKTKRRVEFGWLDFDFQTQEYKQVKAPSGGGTRHETWDVNTSLGDLLPIAKQWFFPNGQSRRGNVRNFDYCITDATHKPLDEDSTIFEVYETSKCKMLRLYLASHKKTSQDDNDASPDGSADEFSSGLEDAVPKDQPEAQDLEETRPVAKKRKQKQPEENNDLTQAAGAEGEVTSIDDTRAYEELRETLPDIDIQFGKLYEPGLIELDDTIIYVPCEASPPSMPIETDPDVWTVPGTSSQRQATTVDSPPRSPTPPPPASPPIVLPPSETGASVITIHRSQIQKELVGVFMDPDIVQTPLRFKFVDEKGADARGLSREAYAAFWKEFFLTSSRGETERVPAIFPEYGQDEWEALGRILLKGYQDTGVFPLQFSCAFSVAMINGFSAVTPDILLESLRKYLCVSDAKIVDMALNSPGRLSEEDKEDLLDLLARVECHSIPSEDEMRPKIVSIANKELIQLPKFAIDYMASTARDGLQALLPDAAAIKDMYATKTPTARKIIKLLHANPVTQDEAAALSYLKEFIKGLDHDMLKKFLRHVTSAEMICTPQIQVTFNRMRGLGRAPKVHTCGPLLELPSTYTSYPDLRREFISILESNYLQMDIA